MLQRNGPMIKGVFVNLPVKNLDQSIWFFKELGFTFDTRFTDANAACLVLGENMYAMLLVEKFYQTFTSKMICDATRQSETMVAVQLASREAVDNMVRKAAAAGGRIPNERPTDHGWMYEWAFEDLDGHIWDPFWAADTRGEQAEKAKPEGNAKS